MGVEELFSIVRTAEAGPLELLALAAVAALVVVVANRIYRRRK